MPLFFCLIIIFTIWLRYKIKKNGHQSIEQTQKFWTDEAASNQVRRADISKLDYLHIPLEQLPSIDTADRELAEYKKTLLSLSEKKILNLTGISNTELKLQYGPANLTFLTSCDENFTQLCRTLQKLGSYYYNSHDYKKSKDFLEYAASCKSDVTASYLLLAKIYKEEYPSQSTDILYHAAQYIDELRRPHYLAELEKILCA